MAEPVDIVVIGAGVVGLAIARALSIRGRDVLVMEQHRHIGEETSSRNSEVIHAGIYYPSDSNKARWCVAGKKQLYDYCQSHQVPFSNCGKMIVAVDQQQIGVLEKYAVQARANGVEDLVWLSAAQIEQLEPRVSAVAGLLSPSTGIIDSHSFMLSLQGELESSGGVVAFECPVERVSANHSALRPVRVTTPALELDARWVINAAGLHAPDIAAQLDPSAPRAYYARGHYYAYSETNVFSRLVYPIAEPGGLGVHVTLDLAGQVKFGPDVQWVDDIDYHFDEDNFDNFVRSIKRYFPSVERARLHPSYTGIRPKISDRSEPAADFRIDAPSEHGIAGLINLLGIESPGLTASLHIAEQVVLQMEL